MLHKAHSIRTFIGAKNFEISRAFYKDMGFEESIISNNMSYFRVFSTLGFYLQNTYVKDWIDNSMIFLEVNNLDEYFANLNKLKLVDKYQNVKLVPIRNEAWGRECFLHDPSGVS